MVAICGALGPREGLSDRTHDELDRLDRRT